MQSTAGQELKPNIRVLVSKGVERGKGGGQLVNFPSPQAISSSPLFVQVSEVNEES